MFLGNSFVIYKEKTKEVMSVIEGVCIPDTDFSNLICININFDFSFKFILMYFQNYFVNKISVHKIEEFHNEPFTTFSSISVVSDIYNSRLRLEFVYPIKHGCSCCK